MKDNTKTRMTKFIKTKFKILEEIGLLWSNQPFQGKYNIGFGIPIEFPSQIKKYLNRSKNNEIMLYLQILSVSALTLKAPNVGKNVEKV